MGKYLDFYNKCMEDGESLPFRRDYPLVRCMGLCYALEDNVHDEYFGPITLFEPDDKDEESSSSYWGGVPTVFTPIRQNIVLFLAAIHGEFDKKPKRK
jgi:hypothetical protein